MIKAISLRGKKIGEINGDTYISHRLSDKHFYIKGRGYPITNDVLKLLKKDNVLYIQIVEHGKKAITIYRTTLQKYMDAVMIAEGGFEPQRCVPLTEMNKVSYFEIK